MTENNISEPKMLLFGNQRLKKIRENIQKFKKIQNQIEQKSFHVSKPFVLWVLYKGGIHQHRLAGWVLLLQHSPADFLSISSPIASF